MTQQAFAVDIAAALEFLQQLAFSGGEHPLVVTLLKLTSNQTVQLI